MVYRITLKESYQKVKVDPLASSSGISLKPSLVNSLHIPSNSVSVSGLPPLDPFKKFDDSTSLERVPTRESRESKVADLKKDEYFLSLIKPAKRIDSLSSPDREMAKRHISKAPRRPRMNLSSSSVLPSGDVSSPLSLLSQSQAQLSSSLPDPSKERSQSSSSLLAGTSKLTAGPTPPFPSLQSLRKSMSTGAVVMPSDSLSSAVQIPLPRVHSEGFAVGTAGHGSSISFSDEIKSKSVGDSLDAILKSSLNSMIIKEESQSSQLQPSSLAALQELGRRGSSGEVTSSEGSRRAPRSLTIDASASMIIKSSPVGRRQQWGNFSESQSHLGNVNVSAQNSSNVSDYIQFPSSPTFFASNSDRSLLSPFRPPSPPYPSSKGLAVIPAAMHLPQQTYRKHKALPHKLQLNKGFKYTKKSQASHLQ